MKKAAALLFLVLASVALVACGGSSSSSSTSSGAEGGPEGGAAGGKAAPAEGGGATISLETDPEGQLAYTQTSVSAKPGNVTVDLTNPQELSHDVAIEGPNGQIVGKTELVDSGSASTTVKLKPGTYHYFCTVPGHREAGMEGTLTVK